MSTETENPYVTVLWAAASEDNHDKPCLVCGQPVKLPEFARFFVLVADQPLHRSCAIELHEALNVTLAFGAKAADVFRAHGPDAALDVLTAAHHVAKARSRKGYTFEPPAVREAIRLLHSFGDDEPPF